MLLEIFNTIPLETIETTTNALPLWLLFLISFVGGYFIYTFLIGIAIYVGIALFTKDKKFKKYGWIVAILGTVLGFVTRIIILGG